MTDKAGTVETPRGPIKGITLVDPETGIPYIVGTVVLDASEVEVGKVVLKDDLTATTATVDANGVHVAVQNTVDVNITNAELSIELSAADGDSVKLSDGTNDVVVNDDGSINVKIVGSESIVRSEYVNFGTLATDLLKSSPGTVFSLTCENVGTTKYYIQIHDKATAVVSGDIPLKNYPVYKNGFTFIGSEIFGPEGLTCTSGIAWAWSTTAATYTPATAADQIVQISWV